MIDNIEELEEALDEILPSGYSIDKDDHGQIIIFTALKEDEDGELVSFDEEDADLEVDSDFEPLEDEDEDDE